MNTPTNASDYYDLDTVTEHYIECALWSSTHYEDEDDSGTPFDEVDAELSDAAKERMKADCQDFLDLLNRTNTDPTPH
jgi:hypothetical protein